MPITAIYSTLGLSTKVNVRDLLWQYSIPGAIPTASEQSTVKVSASYEVIVSFIYEGIAH